MINDTDVDLTMEHKFHVNEWANNKHYINTERKLFKGYSNADILEKYCRTFSHRLPWVRKMNELNSDVQFGRRNKYKGDIISNEFQCPVRRTSDNHIMYMSTNPDIPTIEEALEEVYYEVIGYMPDYNSIKKCWHCGKVHLSHAKHLSMLCPSCYNNYDVRIPWRRR